jgi:hypothetical protein
MTEPPDQNEMAMAAVACGVVLAILLLAAAMTLWRCAS